MAPVWPEKYLQWVVESSPNALVMADSDGRIVLANAQAEKCFGYRREEMVGQVVEMLVPERFRGGHLGYRHDFRAAPQARPMGAGRDLFGRRKDGSEVPMEIGLSPVYTPEGTFVLASIVDITERKRSELALRHAQEELKRSNEELEQFAYIISHDLQEPLRQVSGFVRLFEERQQDLDEQSRQFMQFILEGTTRMSTLIQDLLSYSRVGARDARLQDFSCQEAMENALVNLRTAIDESHARVTHDELPVVMGNPTRLTQLFQNLIGNAIKFQREGVAPQVHVGCRPEGGRWLLWVQDNGIGIEAAHQDKVFQIFHRLHSRDKYPGTGIGLAICKKIVQQHGGRIWIHSKSGQGTTFFFTLPQEPDV